MGTYSNSKGLSSVVRIGLFMLGYLVLGIKYQMLHPA